MTSVQGVSGSGSSYVAEEPEPTVVQPSLVGTGDPLTELAALLVENDAIRAALDDESLRSAREAQRRAMADEVDAMRRAADAVVQQALVQGGFAAAGGLASAAGSFGQLGNAPPARGANYTELCAFRRCNAELDGLGKLGGGLANVAAPLANLTGGVEERRAQTDAREAAQAGEQAGWRADDATRHRDRVERHTDAVIDLVENILETEQQGTAAILSNF